MRKFLFWLVFDGPINLGRLGPYILGLAMGRMPHRVKGAK
jgi:hypothetical protein